MGDISDEALKPLVAVQLGYARRVVSASPNSLVEATLGELGLPRLRERFLSLAVRDMARVAKLPELHPTRLGACDSAELWRSGDETGYHAQLDRRLREYGLALPRYVDLMVDDWADDAEARIKSAADDAYVAALLAHRSTAPLLLHPAMATRRLRPYLMLKSVAGRVALARLRLGCHDYEVRAGRPLPRDQRICRKCKTAVETEEHALLECEADAFLATRRSELLAEINVADPALPHTDDALVRLRLLVNHESLDVLALVARLAVTAAKAFKGLPQVNKTTFRDGRGLARGRGRGGARGGGRGGQRPGTARQTLLSFPSSGARAVEMLQPESHDAGAF